MTDSSVRAGEQGQHRVGEPVWDTSTLKDHACDVVSATVSSAEVIVNFGATHGGRGAGTEVIVELRRRIALQPRAARNLRDVLRDLIGEADASGRK